MILQTNIRDIRSGYPHIHRWLRYLYWNVPAFKDTTNFTHIKNHYTKSHGQVCSSSHYFFSKADTNYCRSTSLVSPLWALSRRF